MVGLALQNNTISGGSTGLGFALEAFQLNPLKILNQLILLFFF